MEYIETLEPLEPHFMVKEWATPEEYYRENHKFPPAFNYSKPIKLWSLPTGSLGTSRQVTYDCIATSDRGDWIYDINGVYQVDLNIMLPSEIEPVNIPISSFNYAAYPDLKKVPRPLAKGFFDNYDVVNSPDGFAKVARNKSKYQMYLAGKNNALVTNKDFENKVLTTLDKIAKTLKIT